MRKDKTLKEIQQLFSTAILKEEGALFLSEIEEGGRITPKTRLGIYAFAYKARLRDVLGEDYPVLHEMVGDEVFHQLANDYIDRHPSDNVSLRYFGRHMKSYLREHEIYSEQACLAEMAEFEWAFNDVFDGADAAAVTLEEVGQIPPEAWTILRFKLHPTFQMLSFHWNIIEIWNHIKENPNDRDDIQLDYIQPEKMKNPREVILWRKGLVSQYKTLDSDEADALKLLHNFKSFPDICERLSESHGDDAPVKAVTFLQHWVNDGMITELDYGTFYGGSEG